MGNEFKWLLKEGSWYSRLQNSCNMQAEAEQWKTTIDLPHMNLIIFPASACPTLLFNCGFPWFSLLVARLLQSAVYIYSLITNLYLCADAVILQCIFCHALAYTITQNYAHIIWMSNLACFPCGLNFSCFYKCSRRLYICMIVKSKKKNRHK